MMLTDVQRMRYSIALRFAIYLVVYLFALLIAALTIPLVALFADKEGNLPKYLKWYQTPDATTDGDVKWECLILNKFHSLSPGLQTYVRRVGWLYRNPIYTFSITVLGAPKQVDVSPTIFTKDNFHKEGFYLNKYFMVYKMDDNPTSNRRRKIFIGWKLQTEAFEKYPFVFLINPFQKYK